MKHNLESGCMLTGDNSYLSGGNMTYMDSLYADYLADPALVPMEWREFFKALPLVQQPHQPIQSSIEMQSSLSTGVCSQAKNEYQAAVTDLINGYRAYGHLAARLDPLELIPRSPDARLELGYYNLDASLLDSTSPKSCIVPETISKQPINLVDLQKYLQSTYCGSIGIEYMHIADQEEVEWIQKNFEATGGRRIFRAEEKRNILHDLIAADGWERYLATRFVGQKRFSLEGGDSLIPMLKEIIRKSAASDVKELMIGMAHRGRLNVLVNVLGKSAQELFLEFEGKSNHGRTGDVKYHLGYSADLSDEATQNIVHVALAFNPSHLEIIGPVVEGSARSRLRRRHDLDKKDAVVPVLIHGDAAFAGQGVVMETLNFSQARGYCTGGTVHIVINNQIGFTTSNPLDARSTLYCTDVAKMIQAPIIHVNGDDPEAVVYAVQIAFDFRMRFKRDIVIDLVCYRRQGHNEADEPSVTQPVMYQKIKSLQTLRDIYAKQLISESVITEQQVVQAVDQYRDKLDKGLDLVETIKGDFPGKIATDWTPYLQAKWTDKVNTAVDTATLQKLSQQLLDLPSDCVLHPTVRKLLDDRAKMAEGSLPMNWGFAETMAYATLVHEGYAVRLSGQDSGRGTFAHRHAVLHDLKSGETYVPLEKIASPVNSSVDGDAFKHFQVIDSVLSEEAVLAFEYGYAASEPTTLVLWEAQFGDFANGAQVVIDQFISSGEQKWGRLCGLVMLLPHGYEGQGPEHSSARLERYMQLCAQNNIQVCTPTTPAQIFHLLRRQMVRLYRKPLIIMTPKSLLRHKLAVSELADLTQGKFHTVISEIDALASEKVTRIILCCGKVYYDLLQKRRDDGVDNTAIIRIEQLYPFPKKALRQIIEQYPNAKKVIWCQEEPQNQGVWFSSQHNMRDCLRDDQTLQYAGRSFAASPAVGSPVLHAQQQAALVLEALYD